MWSKAFWLAALERAIKTAAQSAILALGAGAVDVLSVPWQSVGALAAGGAVLSLLTTLATGAVTGQASAGPERLK